jgi:hypothetical protein
LIKGLKPEGAVVEVPEGIVLLLELEKLEKADTSIVQLLDELVQLNVAPLLQLGDWLIVKFVG